MRKFFNQSAIATSLVITLASVLAGCGGDDSTPSKTIISKVYVMGDSLADAGTFGFKFTVQDASNSKGFPIWPQIVANSFGLEALAQCNFYNLNLSDGSKRSEPNTACTNFAIGGGRVVHAVSGTPFNVGVQMAAKTGVSGNYTASDLVLIDGGGNDAADLVSAYLGASSDSAGLTAYQNFLKQQLDTTTVSTLLAANTGAAQAAGAYMQKLADTFYGQIKSQVLDKGASRVAVLNIPDITLTPRFKAVLAGVTSQAGATQAQALQSAVRQWIGAFNTKLKENIGTDTRVALVDFYADLTDQVNNPSKYGLTNVADTACPSTGTGTDGLLSYTLPSCTSKTLDQQVGKTAGWWKDYAFSDNFHPTPLGHSLLAASVSRSLVRAGWL